VKKATGLAVRFEKYGLPVIECRRWALQEADARAALAAPTDSATPAATEAAGEKDVTPAAAEGEKQMHPAADVCEGDSNVVVEKNDVKDTAENSDEMVPVEREKLERELTRATLEADR
jgi:hypothetical protein